MRKKSKLFRNLCILAIVLATFLPFVPIIVWSFSYRWAYPNLVPELGMRAWQYMFTQKEIIQSLFVSVGLSGTVTIVSLIVGFPASRALGLYEFRGKRLSETILTLPAIVPALGVLMGLQVIYIKIGLINTFWGVVIAHLIPTMPYMIMYLTSTFEDYQIAYEQQARTLGASPLRCILGITIPIIWPGIIVAALYSFLVSWSQYLLTIMVGGPAVKTLPTILFAFLGSGDYAVSSAVALIFILPALLMLALSSKYLSGDKSSLGGGNRI